jgi:hypothetical protein
VEETFDDIGVIVVKNEFFMKNIGRWWWWWRWRWWKWW